MPFGQSRSASLLDDRSDRVLCVTGIFQTQGEGETGEYLLQNEKPYALNYSHNSAN
jgi:hypothetical protein